MNSKKIKISNWGNFPVIESQEFSPRNSQELHEIVTKYKGLIARGNERCYGDANLEDKTISMLGFNRFLSFDRKKGILKVEAGVLLSEILEVIVPAGFFLAVTPGTKLISIGGALASDVHGKNHHVDGCFSNHVLSFELMNEKGELMNCTREENADLFWVTIGGMGLTGILVSVEISLKKIESNYIRQESIKAKNLDEVFSLLKESENWTYTVAWLDCLQKGKALGRSVLMRGEHALLSDLTEKQKQEPLLLANKRKLTVPFVFPSFVLNKWSVKAFNFLFYNKQQKKRQAAIIDSDTFFYPLDAISHWNRIYGKEGFIQYQFVLPKKGGQEGMRKIIETISLSGNGSFLVVIKLFGPAKDKAYNSFPIEGYTLALDFKINKELTALVESLDALVEAYGGRIYRAKDSLSKSSLTNYLRNVNSTTFTSHQNTRINHG